MKYHQLETKPYRSPKRLGRGIAAGQGKTAGRGTKGQKSRTGSRRRPGFEGGQNPLTQRLPKLGGFRSTQPKTENVYTGQLNQFSGRVDNTGLAHKGLVTNPYTRVKLISQGEVTQKLTVELQAASASAVAALEKAGGSFVKMPQLKRLKTENDKRKTVSQDKQTESA